MKHPGKPPSLTDGKRLDQGCRRQKEKGSPQIGAAATVEDADMPTFGLHEKAQLFRQIALVVQLIGQSFAGNATHDGAARDRELLSRIRPHTIPHFDHFWVVDAELSQLFIHAANVV